jgi:hypothetical protein
MDYSLCMPTKKLSCFACCPPIRPAGYDHLQDKGSWRRMLSENRELFLAGQLPDRVQIGFSCPGLGFLDSNGTQAGCLLHPARNRGRDLREPTGYREKCARESCPQSRAYAALKEQSRALLIKLCEGMDPFTYSSRIENPLMLLLAFGPEVATNFASLGLSIEELTAWPWLREADPAHGWLLARMLDLDGPGLLQDSRLAHNLSLKVNYVTQRLGPAPPMEQGQLLNELCDEWEARFWRQISGRRRARWADLETWRDILG